MTPYVLLTAGRVEVVTLNKTKKTKQKQTNKQIFLWAQSFQCAIYWGNKINFELASGYCVFDSDLSQDALRCGN